MKPVLILQHQTPEYPAYLATWLNKHHITYETFNGETTGFPDSIEPYSALAVMGGAMSANDPLLSNKQAEILILQAMLHDIPVIGHCLGGQLMAKALGAKITKSHKPEIGWQPIKYVDNPIVKEWFGSDPTNIVIHWHYESFGIPTGAVLLASSDACHNQAFSIGKHLAMQFHIEIDNDKAIAWSNDEDIQWKIARMGYDTVQNKTEIVEGIIPHLAKHQSTADSIYNHWLHTTEWYKNIDV